LIFSDGDWSRGSGRPPCYATGGKSEAFARGAPKKIDNSTNGYIFLSKVLKILIFFHYTLFSVAFFQHFSLSTTAHYVPENGFWLRNSL